nr:uncharacterized protein LOC112287762 isoform X2 [Physcomitrium patens]|eukprot:XP_024386898.1 uncharacterized protein LOC112287762 isoform X2 [Physcomitrella patens]
MGCIFSSDADDGGPLEAPVQSSEVFAFVPGLREPKQSEIAVNLKGKVSPALATKLISLRSQIISLSGRNGSLAKTKLRAKSIDDDTSHLNLEKALNEYLPVLLGLVVGGEKLSSAVKFPWTNVVDAKKDTAIASGYYELLSVLHLLGMLALQEANAYLTSKPPADGYYFKVDEESKRRAIDLLLKAASYFECAIRAVLPNTPDEIKAKLPADVTEAMFRSLELQALGQAVELQLGFAVASVKASLAVKRRLACEQVEIWDKVVQKLGSVPLAKALRDKHELFVKWKLNEAKAAAYYYHSQVLEEGCEDNVHAQSLSCMKASHAFLKGSQKARNEFGNTEPLTKLPIVWGSMKYLSNRIPRETSSKGRIFRDNYLNEKMPRSPPKLPEFPIALVVDPFSLPSLDPAWMKERGYEARTSLTPAVPVYYTLKDQIQPPVPDLSVVGPMPPPATVTDLHALVSLTSVYDVWWDDVKRE